MLIAQTDETPDFTLMAQDADLTCPRCGSGPMLASQGASAYWQAGQLLVIAGIPSHFCLICEARFVSPVTALSTDHMRGAGFEQRLPLLILDVPVYAFRPIRTL